MTVSPIRLPIQVLIPHFTGNMIDNVVERGDKRDFHRSTLYLVLAAFACATFSGIRYASPFCQKRL